MRAVMRALAISPSIRRLASLIKRSASIPVHQYACVSLWGLDKKCGIRPAIGYSSLPDQSLIFELDRFLKFDEIGIKLTENGAMSPSASTAGLVIVNNSARYFEIGMITDERHIWPSFKIRVSVPSEQR